MQRLSRKGVGFKRIRSARHPSLGDDIVWSAWKHAAVHERTGYGYRPYLNIPYGGSAYSFYMDQKMPNYSLKKWESIVRGFYAKYSGLKQWQDTNINRVMKNQGVLRGITGRKFIFDRDKKKGGYRVQQIKNYPVQSFATADLMPLAMVIIYKRFKARGFKSKIIMQIHDALIFDVKKEELNEIAKLCVKAFEDVPAYVKKLWGRSMSVPITGDIDVGTCWGNVKEYTIK